MKKRMKKVEERGLENTKKLSNAVKAQPVRTPSSTCAHLKWSWKVLPHPMRTPSKTCAHLKWCRADLSSAKQNSFWDFWARFSQFFSPFLLIFVDELGRSLEFLVILSSFMMISFISSSILLLSPCLASF